MRNFLQSMRRSLCFLAVVVIVFTSVSIGPTLARTDSTAPKSPPTPASIRASEGTNASTLKESAPASNEEELKSSPHVYDMRSLRKFDRELYEPGETPSQTPDDRS